MTMEQIHLTFPSGELTLEGVLHMPQQRSPVPGVVVCHPHSVYGGDMHNNIVVALCQALPARGIATLRFNFRGVGQSQGEFGRGIGEVDDAAEAVSFLALYQGVDASRIGIAGYSFGAGIALEASVRGNLVQAVASIACPIPSLNDLSVHQLVLPKLLIAGDLDHVVPGDQFSFLARRFIDPKEVHLVYGVDHFFRGHEPEVAQKAADFFARWLGVAS